MITKVRAIEPLVDEYVEMIEPEIGHDLAELVIGMHCPHDRDGCEFGVELAQRAAA